MIEPNIDLNTNFNPTRHIDLWLGSEDSRVQTYCMICRSRLVGVHQRIVVIVPSGMLDLKFLTPPIDLHCKKCNTMWHLKNII